ncbi:MAG: NAD-dependent succinate-semialdehyde dehydrogenase [Pseudomonadota bacterium]
MSFQSINPVTGQLVETLPGWDAARIDGCLARVATATPAWSSRTLEERGALLQAVAGYLRSHRDRLAGLITEEMGKLLAESRAEIDKCAWACEYYAEHGPEFLADELIETDAGRSLVACQPLGTLLAVMPWNFPFWQVIRAAAPALMAGNTLVLKHAANVPRCALAIEEVFREAGLPEDAFRTLMIRSDQVASVIDDPRVHAVTLTGSEAAGRAVAAAAGRNLKKSVLELGGSDPFVVLEDADLDQAVAQAVKSRFLNAGQSCIAAKRFIVVDAVADAFVEAFKAAVEALRVGDPAREDTDIAPLARADLREALHAQVTDALDRGAEAVTGCRRIKGAGFFYRPSILAGVTAEMRAYREELFGPVATVLRVPDEQEALRLANDNPYGLGGSVWTADVQRGETFARAMQCGSAFVNGMVKSDPRLPFGGIKASGYGRELSRPGIREFVNAKTIWIK